MLAGGSPALVTCAEGVSANPHRDFPPEEPPGGRKPGWQQETKAGSSLYHVPSAEICSSQSTRQDTI